MNLWRVRIDEDSGKVLGDPEPLTTPAQWSGRSASPRDGRRIVYATRDGRSNLERLPFDPVAERVTGPAVPVTQGSTRMVRSGDVSPDGRWLVYDTSSPQEDLFLIRPDGTGVRQLTNDVHKDRVPRWSPDGDRILFYSDRSSKSYEAWTIRPDGSGIQQISAAHGVPLFDPIWSPDARRILYSLESRVEIVDAALPPVRQVPRLLPAMTEGRPEPFLPTSWSPDGEHLLGAIQGTTRETEIALYSFVTGRYQVLPLRGSGAVWLDDARAVYLHEGGLYLLDTRTGASRKLAAPPERSVYRVVSAARDGRNLYVVREINEGDIKMLEMQ